nr:MAG TPA: hypothetical protein [Caudoviricetes sp.]
MVCWFINLMDYYNLSVLVVCLRGSKPYPLTFN